MTASATRSMLYVPADRADLLSRGLDARPDTIVLDLEDSVGEENKPLAHAAIPDLVRQVSGEGIRAVVRIRSMAEAGSTDLEVVAASPPDAVLLAKCDSVEDVEMLAEQLDGTGMLGCDLWVMIETARALADMTSIVSSSDRVSTAVLGLADLATDLGVAFEPGAEPLTWCRRAALVAARASGRRLIDGVDLVAPVALAARRAAREGFDGLSLVRANDVAECNEGFVADGRRHQGMPVGDRRPYG